MKRLQSISPKEASEAKDNTPEKPQGLEAQGASAVYVAKNRPEATFGHVTTVKTNPHYRSDHVDCVWAHMLISQILTMELPPKNTDYKDQTYWDKRYEEEESYDWFSRYSAFKNLVEKTIPVDSSILMLGNHFHVHSLDSGIMKILVLSQNWIEDIFTFGK